MRKIFPLQIEGRHPDRVADAMRHEIRKYLKRERRRELPAGSDFWDFDCRCGSGRDSATPVHLNALFAAIDALRAEGQREAYVEILARPATRTAKAGAASQSHDAEAENPAFLTPDVA